MTAQYEFPNTIAFFLDQGSNINTQTNDGVTALSIAISYNNPDVFELLISRGADLNIADRLGFSPLHTAAEKDKITFVQSLVESGCDVHATSMNGQTPLHIAIGKGNDEIIKYLIQSGADLGTLDCYGLNPSNWLQHSRPDLKISHSSSELVQDASSFPNMAVLRRTMVRLAPRLKEAESRGQSDYLCTFARCFLFLGMEDDARLVYEQIFLIPRSLKSCDGCSTHLNNCDQFFVCKMCMDTDSCETCMQKYHENKGFKNGCLDHEFIQILAPNAKLGSNGTDAFNDLLQKTAQLFGDS